MATQLGNFDGAGDGHSLTIGGEYAVGEGVRITSTGGYGIRFQLPNNTLAEQQVLTIAGAVRGGTDGYAAVKIDNNSSPESASDNVLIRVTQTGVLSALDGGRGIDMNGFRGAVTVENAGFIFGDYGISLVGGAGLKTITNSGVVSGAETAITAGGSGASVGNLILRNTGQIVGGNDMAIQFSNGSSNANAQIFNAGFIRGGVQLGAGDDLYDGRGGQVIGLIDGRDGDDRFIPGAARDSIAGGLGEDVLDFRSSRGVNVALDGSFTNTGVARGDTYTGIENIRGSLKGADKLRGDAQGNDLFGYGGADTLVGAAGNDRLNGGLGRDRLSGGDGADIFVFNSLRERGDTITDFAGGFALIKDGFFINLKGFGLSGSTFKQGWYREGNSNVARDRDDHFIFRKTDTTLWFDADGRGGRGPVLLANLQAGAELDWSQFNNLGMT